MVCREIGRPTCHSIGCLRQTIEAMLGKLLGKNGGKSASTPPGFRLYAIGDVHGCLKELNALLDLINEDTESASLSGEVFGDDASGPLKPVLVFLGDYIDRGPDSKGVLDRLIELQDEDIETMFLKGNHEAAMLDFMAAPRRHLEWMHWGGAETLESYGLENVWSRDEEDLAAELSINMPPEHRDFLETLELTHEAGDFIFVHAGLKPGVALNEQEEDDLIWIRSEFHRMPAEQRPDKVVVHGHHPVKKPDDKGWRVNVDTGACWSGMLTAVVLEDGKRRFLST